MREPRTAGWKLVRRLGLLAVLGCGVPAAAQESPPPGPYVNQMVVKVPVNDKAELERALAGATASWDCEPRPGKVLLQVTAEQLAALKAQGFEPVMVVPDVQVLLDAERREIDQAHAQADASWFVTFRTLTEINTRLDEYAANYPTLVTAFSAGTSLQGRPIRGVEISAPDLPGNPRANRPAVIYNACQHAREWATPMTAMWIADRLLENYGSDPTLSGYLNDLRIIVIPVSNPDGYEFTWTNGNRLWRKNRRQNANGTFGVDLNRNWGYQWGGEGSSDVPNSETYRGATAFSEPESQALGQYMAGVPHLVANIDFHSYGELVLTPWGYTAALPPDRPIFREIENSMARAIFDVHGVSYSPGPTYTNIYPAAGVVTDWAYGELGILATSIEVRADEYGFVMPSTEIIPNAEENMAAALRLADYARLPLIFAPVDPLPDVITPETGGVNIAVRSSAQTLAGPPLLFTRINGGGQSVVTMTPVAGTVYSAALPSVGCGENLEYFFQANTTAGTTVYYPASAPSQPFHAGGSQPIDVFSDDMEMDTGWTVGAPGDTATLGIWSRCDPEPTAAQPGDDHTSGAGSLAWITDCRAGNGVGAFDVDGGTTTLTSPTFSAIPANTFHVASARLSCWLWYSNNQGSAPNLDSMAVQVSNDAGGSWHDVSAVSANTGEWSRYDFELAGVVPLTAAMRVRFVARDLNAPSIVEAGVDDVTITVFGCPADPDVNCDGNLDGFDVRAMEEAVGGDLSDFCRPDPDFNGDGSVDGFDVRDVEIAVGGG